MCTLMRTLMLSPALPLPLVLQLGLKRAAVGSQRREGLCQANPHIFWCNVNLGLNQNCTTYQP